MSMVESVGNWKVDWRKMSVECGRVEQPPVPVVGFLWLCAEYEF
jgi:hypothetical protein